MSRCNATNDDVPNDQMQLTMQCRHVPRHCSSIVCIWRRGRCSPGGSSRCAGLLGRRREETLSGGAPAARGCSSTEGRRRLYYWGDLPLRGAARSREGGGSLLGISRCAGLPVRGEETLSDGGAPAARGCSIEGGRRLFLGELPLRGAARHSEGLRKLFLRDLPLHGAARR